ncbi:MAG: ATP-binding protein [Nevskiales bacterium]|nr:ATP-binding protein [Nevskiales bacterium]
MRSRLFWKLFGLQLLAAVVLVAGSLALMRMQTVQSFSAYVEARERARMRDAADRIAEAVAEGASLRDAANEAFRPARHRRRDPAPDPDFGFDAQSVPEGAPPPREDDPPPPRARMAPLSASDPEGRRVAGPRLPRLRGEPLREPIQIEGALVGYVLRPALPEWRPPEEAGFARRQSRGLISVGAAALLVAIVFGSLITYLVLRPIRRLSDATGALAHRRFETRLKVDRKDELGQLAADFNRLAEALQRYDLRQRQWLADIAHELRTPLAVLRGELEAMIDGVRAADGASLDSLQQEVGRLNRLVDDLHLLSLAESGGLKLDRAPCDLGEVIDAAVARFRPRFEEAGFALRAECDDASLRAEVDRQRIEQVLGNLLANALQHADVPGPVSVSARAVGDTVRLSVCDAGPGVPQDALPRLFDRLYRVEAARSRPGGGSGLGLAICRSIVEAHGGRIEACAAPGGGLCIHVELPRAAG